MTNDMTALQGDIEKLPDHIGKVLERAVGQATMILIGILSEYPPATEANRPGRIREVYGRPDESGRRRVYLRPVGYYERNRGWWDPRMKRESLPTKTGKARGAILATKRIRTLYKVAGYKLRKGGESQHLGRSWSSRVTATESGVTGIIGNNASYVDFVQGTRQTKLSRRRGWTSVDDAIGKARDDIEAICKDAVAQIALKIQGGL